MSDGMRDGFESELEASGRRDFLKKLAIGYAERHAVIPELFM